MITKEFVFANGDEVRDKVTGFQGAVLGTAYYLTGCSQYLVMPECEKSNKQAKGQWFDEERLDMVTVEKHKANTVQGKEPGADMPAPGGGREY